MLGVLKRRWKPKRASTGRRVGQGKAEPALQGDAADNKPPRNAASPRQIHPVCEDRTQLLAYENKPAPAAILATSPSIPLDPPSYPAPPPLPTYPLTPNICVEGGRIEFIKTPPDVATDRKFPPTTSSSSSTSSSVQTPASQQPHTVTRAQQTVDGDEKADVAKESLEARVLELERALEAEQKIGQRERLALTRLQRQLARREVLQRDVDRERRLRLDTEVRLRDSTSEADRCRARLASLQREFGRMEETVRSMLQYKARSEQLKQEKTSLTVAYETRIHQFQNSITKLGQENEALRKQICILEAAGAGEVQNTLLERLRDLEAENCNLTRDAELQRRQYERCLDDVANQVVRALLTQKGLREEIVALQRRIKELEAQNRALASVLVQQLQQGSPGEVGGAGDEPLVGHSAVSNLALPGLYTPSTCPADTPMTSDTSVSTQSSSDLVTPDDDLFKKRHHQELITPTSSDLATPDDDMPKSCLRRQQVTPTSSDLATPEEDVAKTSKLRKHQHVLGKLSWEDRPVDSREKVVSAGALLTSLKSAALADPSMLWLPLQRPRSLNLQLRGNSTGQQVAALAAVTASKCRQHRHSRPLIAHVSGSKVPSVISNNNNAIVMEDEGSESPESGNRDEGYSTMSSDVQGEALRSGDQPVSVTTSCNNGDINQRRGLEDLKEATDETDMSTVVSVSGTFAGTASSPTAIVECSGSGTTVSPSPGGRLLVVEDACDPDVLYIPLGLALGLSTGNPRHSFPPSRDLLPYQHIMRSFSDSHLCLKITTAPSPSPVYNREHSSFSLSSTVSSSPSVLLLDVLTSASAGEVAQKQSHPLRRTKATTSLLATALNDNQESLEEDDTHSNSGSWCSSGDVVVEGCWWDADYVQHWLRLDDTRSALQQQHRDLMELEYDQAELEDWSMSLSCEDIASSAASVASGAASSADSSSWKRPGTMMNDSLTPGQQYSTMLPSIQENNALELEEDSSECLWNNASYLIDHRSGGSELMALLMDDGDQSGDNSSGQKNSWPYGNRNIGGIGGGNYSLASPGGSWSSTGTNSEECCHSYDCSYNGCSGSGTGGCQENSSKRSSAAMSGCSDDAASTESPAVVGTDFTRDFYRLVKFESTKSLASTSSRSLAGGTCVSDGGGSLTWRQGPDVSSMAAMPLSEDREQALQSVLNFIAEQQQYCASREEQDSVKEQSSTSSLDRPGSQECDSCQRSNDDNLAACPGQQTCSMPAVSETKDVSGLMLRWHSSVENYDPKNIVEGQDSADRNVQFTEEDCSKSNTQGTHTCSNLQEDTAANGDSFEEQIHTIIELDTVDQVYASPLEENEIQNSSNKKGRCSEVQLNEQNSSSTKKMQQNNKVIHELKEEQCIDLKEILKPHFQEAYADGNESSGEGICLTMQAPVAEVESLSLLKDIQQQQCDDQKIVANNLQAEHEGHLGKISLSGRSFDRDRDGSGETHAVKGKYVQDSDVVCESMEEKTSKDGNDEVGDADNHVTSLHCPGSSQLPLGQCSKGLVHSLQCSGVSVGCCRVGEVLVTVIEEEDEHASSSMETSSCREMTESMTSTVSTPDTVVSPATRRTQQQHLLDLSVSQTSVAGSISSGSNGGSVIVTDASTHAWSVSFHERATSKDVIDELNRMIRKGEDGAVSVSSGSSGTIAASSEGDAASAMGAKLDVACCCPTGWVHVERDIDFTDPKARANLLDVMLASSGSSGASSSSSSSSSSDSGDEPADYQHLHRLHRFRRQKKASATREQLGVLRYPVSTPRPSIIGRDDFFVRYGDKEREAVASFDFLEDISTTSVSGASSCDTLGSSQKLPATPQPPQISRLQNQQQHQQPPKKQPVQSEQETTTPSSEDSDDRTGGQLSFSDSCAASFSGSSASLENQEQ